METLAKYLLYWTIFIKKNMLYSQWTKLKMGSTFLVAKKPNVYLTPASICEANVTFQLIETRWHILSLFQLNAYHLLGFRRWSDIDFLLLLSDPQEQSSLKVESKYANFPSGRLK